MAQHGKRYVESRGRIDRELAKQRYEHLIVFTDATRTTQVWQWVKREPGRVIPGCRDQMKPYLYIFLPGSRTGDRHPGGITWEIDDKRIRTRDTASGKTIMAARRYSLGKMNSMPSIFMFRFRKSVNQPENGAIHRPAALPDVHFQAALAQEIKNELSGVSAKDLDPVLLEDLKLYRGKGCERCTAVSIEP